MENYQKRIFAVLESSSLLTCVRYLIMDQFTLEIRPPFKQDQDYIDTPFYLHRICNSLDKSLTDLV